MAPSIHRAAGTWLSPGEYLLVVLRGRVDRTGGGVGVAGVDDELAFMGDSKVGVVGKSLDIEGVEGVEGVDVALREVEKNGV